jgi:signal transduction histidine kinase
MELLRKLVRHCMHTQEDERKWVIGQFHKSVSQLAYVILLRCGTLAKKLPEQESASKKELMNLCELTSQMIESIRLISRHLRPSALDDLGLVPVLRADCEEFGKRTHTQLNLNGVRMKGRLPAEIEIVLYRIFQDALQNVQQHAQASLLTVKLTRRSAYVQLTIKDDGVGFAPDQTRAGLREKGKFGLAGMRERASSVGGDVNFKSALRSGTEIEVRIPFPSHTSGTSANRASVTARRGPA